MAQQTERETLNLLIEICRDGVRGFTNAATHVSSPELQKLFSEVAAQRGEFADTLLVHAQRLGGAAGSEGSGLARLHRGWTNMRGALSGQSDLVVVTEAERGEDAALEVYTEALESVLPPEARDIVEEQCAAIRKSRDRIYEIDKSRLSAV
jgi:uncharacterized protein (TIGR02284 family)